MKRLALIASLPLMLAATCAASAGDISGVWLTSDGDAHVRIAPCGANMCGNLVWTQPPKPGEATTDVNNPDPSKRSHPLLGLTVAVDFRPSASDPNKFDGQFYNPDNGKMYKGSISSSGPDTLRVEGCLLIFCRTQTWTRVKR